MNFLACWRKVLRKVRILSSYFIPSNHCLAFRHKKATSPRLLLVYTTQSNTSSPFTINFFVTQPSSCSFVYPSVTFRESYPCPSWSSPWSLCLSSLDSDWRVLCVREKNLLQTRPTLRMPPMLPMLRTVSTQPMLQTVSKLLLMRKYAATQLPVSLDAQSMECLW